MSIFNRFVLQVEKRLSHQNLTLEQKKKIMTRVLGSINETEILTPLSIKFMFEEDELDREEMVLAKQREYGIVPDFPEEQCAMILPWGRGRLHEAILLDDSRSVTQFLSEGDDPAKKDNNGQTPYDLALLSGRIEMVALLESHNAAI